MGALGCWWNEGEEEWAWTTDPVQDTVGSQVVMVAHRHPNVSVPVVSWGSGLSWWLAQGCRLSQVGLELSEMSWSPTTASGGMASCLSASMQTPQISGLFYQALDNSILVMSACKVRGEPS